MVCTIVQSSIGYVGDFSCTIVNRRSTKCIYRGHNAAESVFSNLAVRHRISKGVGWPMSRCHVDRRSTRGNANEENCRNLVSQSVCTLSRFAKNKVGNNPVCLSVCLFPASSYKRKNHCMVDKLTNWLLCNYNQTVLTFAELGLKYFIFFLLQ